VCLPDFDNGAASIFLVVEGADALPFGLGPQLGKESLRGDAPAGKQDLFDPVTDERHFADPTGLPQHDVFGGEEHGSIPFIWPAPHGYGRRVLLALDFPQETLGVVEGGADEVFQTVLMLGRQRGQRRREVLHRDK
jgi:hypothetical protein